MTIILTNIQDTTKYVQFTYLRLNRWKTQLTIDKQSNISSREMRNIFSFIDINSLIKTSNDNKTLKGWNIKIK